MPFECYSQRLLNPFRGAISCIRYRSAEAVTDDGVRWGIYVSNDRLLQELPDDSTTQVSDIRYGRWSREHGLKRGPLFPSEDFMRMERTGTQVYEHLLGVHAEVPFPYRDHYELWLLDEARRPLALLDSAPDPEEIDLQQSPEWRPGLECGRTFTSPAAGVLGIDTDQTGAVAAYLQSYINRRAGASPAAQLFERQPDGRGAGLHGINLDGETVNRILERQAFPPLLLDCRHHDEAHARLVDDFISWQAPWLLLLPDLDRETRAELEQLARVQPVKIARHFHLYPEIVDRALIDGARVEARLRETLPRQEPRETVISPFYIELNPEDQD